MAASVSEAHDIVETHVAAKARIPDAMTRSAVHATFRLVRTDDASTARVWLALTDPTAKAKWFGVAGEKDKILERSMDVRTGGRERLKASWRGEVITTSDVFYFDVIARERLVYAYEMHLDERKISVSVATLELKAEGKKTRLTVTEQGTFLDGYDDAGSREHGTGELLDALGRSLTT